MSLLRGTHNPDTTGDRGYHRFALSLYPHAGDWKQAGTMRRGYEFNLPLRVMPCTPHEGEWGPERSFLGTTLSNVAVTALKRAEDGNGLVLRYYEYDGSIRSGNFTLPKAATAATPVNILEQPQQGSLFVTEDRVSVQTRPRTINTMRLKFE